jgi:hypothetical protein
MPWIYYPLVTPSFLWTEEPKATDHLAKQVVEADPQETGLLDQRGAKIMKQKQPIGFRR